jgi:Asp-tRNA(Asn)/Glu-tRNA(Gln) amidotransferase A subunit family amidase
MTSVSVLDAAGSAAAGVQAPDWLGLSLSARLDRLSTGALDPNVWRDEANVWSSRANTVCRACAQLRPLTAGQPPIRVGVKDTIDVYGYATLLGLRRYRRHPAASAPIVERLRTDAVTLNAKHATTQLNLSVQAGCMNPCFRDVHPGGSSTGSGAAVAANISDIALGSDQLGSIRWPAGRCGVVGLRTTYDVRLLKGMFTLAPSLEAPGWIARTARDLGFAWHAFGLSPRLGETGRQLSRFRVGVVVEAVRAGCDPTVLKALERTCVLLESAGHQVRVVTVGELWHWRTAAWELSAHEACRSSATWHCWLDERLETSTEAALAMAATVSPKRYANILNGLAACRLQAASAFSGEEVDVWLLPLEPGLPRPVAEVATLTSTMPDPREDDYEQRVGYTPLASIAGLPAITFPASRTESAAPIALQAVGPPHSEPLLIRFACAVADLLGSDGRLSGDELARPVIA